MDGTDATTSAMLQSCTLQICPVSLWETHIFVTWLSLQLLLMERRVKGLTLFFVNLRVLCQGAGDLCAAVQDCHPDFVGLVETHLDGASIGMYLPPGYIVAGHKDRTHHGGGVLLLCRGCLLVNASDCADFYVVGSCEFIAVHFRIIAILCVYHQPRDSDITVIDSLSGFRGIYISTAHNYYGRL